VKPTEEPQVLDRRQIGVDGQVLGHVADRSLHGPGLGVEVATDHLDRATVSSEQAAQHRDGRGLARTVGAEQAIGLPGRDREADIVDHRPFAVALDQPPTGEDIARGTPRSGHALESDEGRPEFLGPKVRRRTAPVDLGPHPVPLSELQTRVCQTLIRTGLMNRRWGPAHCGRGVPSEPWRDGSGSGS
jgi:hypothetical protein